MKSISFCLDWTHFAAKILHSDAIVGPKIIRGFRLMLQRLKCGWQGTLSWLQCEYWSKLQCWILYRSFVDNLVGGPYFSSHMGLSPPLLRSYLHRWRRQFKLRILKLREGNPQNIARYFAPSSITCNPCSCSCSYCDFLPWVDDPT